MSSELSSFAARCRALLKAEPGPAGRRKVCALLEQALKEHAFVEEVVNGSTPERKVMYEDPELGFCILGHRYEGGKKDVPPHDHGPTWAIYGQAHGETLMTDFALVEPASEAKPGKARAVRRYSITPGMAHLYNEGELHAPTRNGPTRLVRIEGMNMDKVKRLKFEQA
jgi:hypothetical protein